MSASDKYGLWHVPNYDGSGSSQQPGSYLIVGKASTNPTGFTNASRGDDLLTRAGITVDASNPVNSTPTNVFMDDSESMNGETDRDQKGAKTSYRLFEGAILTDAASATAGAETGSASSPTPSYLTGQLLSRGGWRDHTDGNRISTTRGDRVDFVYGNYKRYILGRLSDTTLARSEFAISTWESSGGHNHDTTSTPGEVESIAWTTTHGGSWQVKEVTKKCNKIDRFSGKKEEKFQGLIISETIGEPRTAGVTPGLEIGVIAGAVTGFIGVVAGVTVAVKTDNPSAAVFGAVMFYAMPLLGLGIGALVEKGDATVDEDSNPIITETTYASSITENTTADSVTESTTVQSGIYGVTRAKTIKSTINVTKTIEERSGDFGHEAVFAIDTCIADTVTCNTKFNQRLLLSVGLVEVGASFVAREFHVYGNTKGPYNEVKFNIAVTLAASRSFEMSASASFFMGTKFALNAAFATDAETPSIETKVTLGIKVKNMTLTTTAGLSRYQADLADMQTAIRKQELSGANLH